MSHRGRVRPAPSTLPVLTTLRAGDGGMRRNVPGVREAGVSRRPSTHLVGPRFTAYAWVPTWHEWAMGAV